MAGQRWGTVGAVDGADSAVGGNADGRKAKNRGNRNGYDGGDGYVFDVRNERVVRRFREFSNDIFRGGRVVARRGGGLAVFLSPPYAKGRIRGKGKRGNGSYASYGQKIGIAGALDCAYHYGGICRDGQSRKGRLDDVGA